MITKDMTIGEVIKLNPNAAQILMRFGMGCLGCPSAQVETVEQACEVHGLNLEEILAAIKDFNGRRRDKQPLDKPSAGSTFKRPVPKEGEVQLYAGKLIEDSGLRGFRIGGAAVSDKHCGFVVNEGGATFEDLMKLIKHVQNTVQSKFGVYLETEVKIIKN